MTNNQEKSSLRKIPNVGSQTEQAPAGCSGVSSEHAVPPKAASRHALKRILLKFLFIILNVK